MPVKAILSCSIFLLLVVSLAQPAKSLGMKPVTTVPLPCESHWQRISPTGNQVAVVCSDQTVRLMNLSSGNTEHTFGPEPRVSGVKYSHDGRWFGVGFGDGTVEVVPTSGTAEGKRWKSDTRGIGALEFTPDSSGIVVAASDRPGQIWDLRGTPETIGNFALRFCRLDRVQFQPGRKAVGDLGWRHGDPILRHLNVEDARMSIAA